MKIEEKVTDKQLKSWIDWRQIEFRIFGQNVLKTIQINLITIRREEDERKYRDQTFSTVEVDLR